MLNIYYFYNIFKYAPYVKAENIADFPWFPLFTYIYMYKPNFCCTLKP